ncbi:MAG: hydantoinase B/oxoprolinase family protein [Burkholderiales bacterium]|nr:hydantoinase B/oxoprolinase family protein [Burkholderiales bacterium]
MNDKKIDQVTLQVLANHCAAAAESMGYTLMRTAHSTFVKETEDFSCQLLTPDGLTFASPRSMGATWYTGLDYSSVIDLFDDYREGDIYLTNDPYSGYVATHSPDVHMWKPVFSRGELVCFIGSHIHNTDMGGAVPASISRTLTEVHQEGLRIPPTRLLRDGKLNEDVLSIIRANVRVPDQNWGDMNAQFACMNVGERKVLEIIERFGHDAFKSGIYQLLDYAEQQARELIRSIPDGRYAFADYADEDSVNGYPARIQVTLDVRGDELELDFTGSDPQLASSMNIPTGGNPRHALLTVGLIYVLYSLDSRILLNSGTVRPSRMVLPEGTAVNAQHPAATGLRSLLVSVAQVAIIGAFTQALPERLPASPSSGLSILNVRTTGRNGRAVMASIGPVGGGAGGSPNEDGAEGCGANMAFLKNTPIEVNEADLPIRIRKYGLVPDSGGAGRYRGGSAMLMEFELFAPGSMVTARNRDRCIVTAWGLRGGQPGQASRFLKNPGGPAEHDLGNNDIVMCDPGDVIRLEGPGGGGYGHPFDRPVDAVLQDVRCGFVSVAGARRDYGVAIDTDGSVDAEQTRALRSVRSLAPPAHYTHGPGRIQFESVWTEQRYAELTRILAQVPVSWRYFVKHKLFAALAGQKAGPDGGGADVLARYRQLAASFPELSEVSVEA